MMVTPNLVFFVSFIFFSVFLVSSSSSWLVCWVGVELNTMAFIPLMLLSKTGREAEAGVKYFLVQTMASVLFLVGVLGLKLHPDFFFNLLVVGLMIKMGVAPFHNWVLSVGEALGWVPLYLMLTLQKVNPLVLFVSSGWTSDMVVLGVIFSIFVGGVMGLSHTNLRKLVIFSSISHLGWLLISVSVSTFALFIYFSIYCAILIPVIYFFYFSNVSYLNQFSSLPVSMTWLLALSISLLSLGGLPPFLGFFPKWLVLSQLMASGNYLLSILLVNTSLLTLFYYLRISYSGFIMAKLVNSPYWNFNKAYSLTLLSLMMTLSLGGFMLVCLY